MTTELKENLKEKYNITEVFYKRYFVQNAENRFANELMKFMWFKEGKFLNPAKKDVYINQFIDEEIESFYEKNTLVMPQIEFNITTKCTLKCKDCCALMPKFNQAGHITMSLEDFKYSLDKLLENVDLLRNLIILGGEPLMHPDLAKMVEYAVQKDKISMINITTNGTMIPNEKLIEVLKKYNNRVFVRMSNYLGNPELKDILKYDKIKEILAQNNIKCQMVDSWSWLKELEFAKEKSDEKSTLKRFDECYRTKCTQMLDKKIDICSKAFVGRELGYIQNKDYIEIEKTSDLRKDLINFYQQEFAEACEYCRISDITVTPALQ